MVSASSSTGSLELIELARQTLESSSHELKRSWHRAAATLTMQALESTLDEFWSGCDREMTLASRRAQLLCLPMFVDSGIAGRVSVAWHGLSHVCHHNAYELPPVIGELESWISEVDEITVSLLSQAAPASLQRTVEPTNESIGPDSRVLAAVKARSIGSLCHFTRRESMAGIIHTGAILSVEAALRRGVELNRNDLVRADGYRDSVSLSIEHPNVALLNKWRWDTDGEWVVIRLHPRLLAMPGTLFCPVNAAQDNGKHCRPSAAGMGRLFEDFESVKGHWRRLSTAMSSQPTSPQAEVLIRDVVPLSEIIDVVVERAVATDSPLRRLCEHSNLKLRVEPRLFRYPKSSGGVLEPPYVGEDRDSSEEVF